ISLLAELREDFTVESWPRCARHLEIAAQWMDDAAISTIHSWAQRMLREHAFDSGKLFRQEIVKDLTEPMLEAVADYWRSLVYPLGESQAAAIVELFGSPQGLHDKLRKLLQRDDAELVFAGEPVSGGGPGDLLALAAQDAAALPAAAAKALHAYQAGPDAIHAALHELRSAMNGSTFRGKNDDDTFAGWLNELRAWGRGDIPLEDAGTFVHKLARTRFRLNKGGVLPALDLWDALQAWHDQRADAEQVKARLQPAVLADARDWVSRRLAAQLESRAQMGFDGMIHGLADALEGEDGGALAQRIRTRFPVAMIDEFQDTDPAQYSIFQRIYRTGSDAPDTALILIGDPKQAIYGFRGGDIHTYLAAREATR
ncbi:MAG: UvrD-helicase domain-containing protein, partial [Chromatocurvus sp.]